MIALVVILLVILDRASKIFVMATGVIRLSPILILSPVINDHPFLMVGISSDVDAVMVGIMPIVHLLTVVALLYSVSKANNSRHTTGAIFLSVGLLSNALDCVVFGGVVDPITFPVGGGLWNAINIADLCILTGYVFIGCSMRKTLSSIRVARAVI